MKKFFGLALFASLIVCALFLSCSNSGDGSIPMTSTETGGGDSSGGAGKEPTPARGEAECRSDMYQTKRLLDIPKAAISGDSFVYCDLPVSVQGFKDVSICWSSDNPSLAVDDELVALSPVNSCQTATLTATLSCGGYTDSKTFSIKLYPKDTSSISTDDCLEAAKFALCFGYRLRQISSKIKSVYTFNKTLTGFGATNITIPSVTTNGNSVEIEESNSSAWQWTIWKTPVKKTVKMTVQFKRGSETSNRVYYIQPKLIGGTEFTASTNGSVILSSGRYKFENGYLISEASSAKTMCKYEMSETDNIITLSVEKKYYDGKWQTKEEWLSQNGSSAYALRRASYEFFANRKFVCVETFNDALEIKAQWEPSVHWTLQFGKIQANSAVNNSYPAYGLPVRDDHFNKFYNNSSASFSPLKNETGMFNSDYRTFTDSGVAYSVSCQESSGDRLVTFASESNSYPFYYVPSCLVELKW